MNKIDFSVHKAAIFRRNRAILKPVSDIDFVNLDDLIGIERQKKLLLENTSNFISSSFANHALLWGARGCGKSSLAKAVFTKFFDFGLRVIQICKDDFIFLDDILDEIRDEPFKFIIFCDDLSFESGDFSYKYLKPLLEGSIEKPPQNVLMYATTNRRHLMPEYVSDNLDVKISQDEIHYSDSIEEKLSLADRFGLSISFYQGSLEEYLKIVNSYFKGYKDKERLNTLAKEFATKRASRSGRTAKQFYLAYKDVLNERD